ncbi:hypothetical protein PR003_g21318 [Phytophthora rubi]|uniref:RxLR effector protein n=1 Tax=Phytophthora rubi TaxID=129364 RepID=A0A6A3J1P6_9STRA|nr:hypothetical protein PR002_g23031 [Phytophthora rubi]KAE8986465.1 hypothetical protein PR001_g22593 [Phytophthora rubi]KAE9306127.1 hypothetical protein PR003_g21318 [Phytophthora rubi]
MPNHSKLPALLALSTLVLPSFVISSAVPFLGFVQHGTAVASASTASAKERLFVACTGGSCS